MSATACASTAEAEGENASSPADVSTAPASFEPTERADKEDELRGYITTECAADLAAELGLDDPDEIELFDVEEPVMSEDASLFGLTGMARYPTASGAATTSDPFNCAITVDESGDLNVTSYTY